MSKITTDNINSEEIKMMRKLHGDNLVLEESGFFKKVTQKDSHLNKRVADAYYNNWKDGGRLQENNEKDVENRRHQAQNMTNAFYDLVTDFYEYGWGQSFHFAKLYKGISGFNKRYGGGRLTELTVFMMMIRRLFQRKYQPS